MVQELEVFKILHARAAKKERAIFTFRVCLFFVSLVLFCVLLFLCFHLIVICFSCSAYSRFVDGIETDSSVTSGLKFDFNTKPQNEDCIHPPSATYDNEETKKSILKLNQEMSSLSQQVTQMSKELQEMLQLLRPLLVTQKYMPPSPVGLLTPSLTATYSNSSGFSNNLQSHVVSTGNPSSNLLRPEYMQASLWPEGPSITPSENVPRKTVQTSLSLDSFLRHSSQQQTDYVVCGPHVTNTSVSPDHRHLPHAQLVQVDTAPLSSSSPVSLDVQISGKTQENKAKCPITSVQLPYQSTDSDSLRGKVTELLSPVRKSRELLESCTLEMIKTSAEDTYSDSIQFIDDDGTNV
nr:PREDICTED: potassium voltage-gated channel subfamily H member 8-like [Latimeria chalumnae]|eukprot:XP_014352907.1 PREDICTED: potassium voltage-gated channel subfamily H member 8-like [Latimeria chalumnae]